MSSPKNAFLVDVNKLLEGFSNYESLSFDLFCTEWKRRKFQHIYSALINDIEIITATTSYLNITKRFLVNPEKSLYERVGSLYLLYILYFKQPTEEFCKIKLLVQEWRALKDLITSLSKEENGKQAEYIFWKLISCNALRFVENETEYILENGSSNRAEGDNIFVSERLPVERMLKKDMNEINNPCGGILTAMKLLEGGYNEMKDLLMKEQDASYQVLNKTNLFEELKARVDAIDQILKETSGRPTCSKDEDEELSRTLRDRRAELKRKAFQNNTTEPNDQDYTISLEGDFIQIIRGTVDDSDDVNKDKEEEEEEEKGDEEEDSESHEKTVKSKRKQNKNEAIKPKASTSKISSKTSKSPNNRKRKRK